MKRLLLYSVLIGTYTYVQTELVTIHNKTSVDLFMTAYYTSIFQDIRQRAMPVQRIPSNQSISFERPSFKVGFDVDLAFDLYEPMLRESLTTKEYQQLMTGSIGILLGTVFYIAYKDNTFKLYNDAEWKIVKPIIDALEQKFNEVVAPFRKAVAPNEYADRVATVRFGADLGPDEQAFRKKRISVNQRGIKTLTGLDVSEQELPRIGLCLSGGGMRAWLACTSFLDAINSFGLLDASSYMVGLSGSTWFISAWALSGKTIGDFKKTAASKIKDNLAVPMLTMQDQGLIVQGMLNRTLYGQDIGPVDLFGALIVRKLLSDYGDKKYFIGFSAAQNNVSNGSIPYPICTAVTDNLSATPRDYTWFEITPFEVYSHYMKASVPVWAWGRTFANGTSTNFAPELSLSFLFGMYGSAFAVGIGDIIERALPTEGPLSVVTGPIAKKFKKEIAAIDNDRLLPGAKVINFARGMPNIPSSANQQKVELVDGGYSGINNPVPPLLRPERGIEIIIIFDVNETVLGSSTLKKATEYAKAHNIKFPTIDFTTSDKKNISVYGNPSNPDELVIIYIPRIKNTTLPAPFGTFDPDKETTNTTGYLNTLNMAYTPEHAQFWMDFVNANAMSHKDVIKDVITKRVQAKKQGAVQR